MRGVAAGTEPRESAGRLLEALSKGGSDAWARLYFLDLAAARYELFASAGPAPRVARLSLGEAGVSAGDLTAHDLEVHPLAGHTDAYRVPIVRDKTMIGVLDLSSAAIADLRAAQAPLDLLSAVFVWIYEQRFASRLLGGIQRPIPYDRNEEWFLADVLDVIRDSSGMAFAAVRERAGLDVLRCLAAHGFGDGPTAGAAREDLTFVDVETRYPAFAEAMRTGEPVAELDMKSSRNRFVDEHDALKDVGSYVVAPIHVGDTVFGTLSLATRVRYPFTPFELQGFKSIANGIGIAIANFRNYHDMTDRFGDIAVGVTALEISTAVRHATGDILDRCGHYLEQIETEVSKPSEDAIEAMSELGTELELLSNELHKFKVATERPVRDADEVSLKERWEYAEGALSGRLTRLGISTPYEGPDLTIVAYKDWIGHLFLNLMLNSMDAFERTRKQRQRQIRLRVKRRDDSGHIRLTYSDNATGIVGTKLVGGAPHVAELPVKQRIFEPHVTSKRDSEEGYKAQPGAGLGLFLVRKVMADHYGSIDLMDSNEGAMFRILFPGRLLVDGS
jgi:GAF domain-containing protein